MRRRTHWPPGRPSWSVCTDFSRRRRCVWLGQPHVHTGRTERLRLGRGRAVGRGRSGAGRASESCWYGRGDSSISVSYKSLFHNKLEFLFKSPAPAPIPVSQVPAHPDGSGTGHRNARDRRSRSSLRLRRRQGGRAPGLLPGGAETAGAGERTGRFVLRSRPLGLRIFGVSSRYTGGIAA